MMSGPESRPDAASVIADVPSGQVLDGWLTRQELARELCVAPKTLARWGAMGIGPVFVRVGTRALYRTGAVREWLVQMEELRRKRAARS